MKTLALCLTLMLLGAPAFAHAFLDNALPPVGGVVRTAPTKLELSFTEPLDLGQSSVKLLSASGATVALGQPVSAPGDQSLMTVPINERLSAGVYRVFWRATAQDGHRTFGDYKFTVAPAL